MNSGCENFIRAVLGNKSSDAIAALGTDSWDDVFRCLATIDRADISRLAGVVPADISRLSKIGPGDLSSLTSIDPADLGDQILGFWAITPLPKFAIATVQSGKAPGPLPPSAPADFGQAVSAYLTRALSQDQPLDFHSDLTGSLPAAGGNPIPLTDNDYAQAASALGIEKAAIQAVASVESSGSGFGSNGLPTIRYELHIFSRKTDRKYTKTHPWLSQDSYAAGTAFHDGDQSTEYSMLCNAMILEQQGIRLVRPAIESTSWGMFQIMGFNYAAAGWSTPEGFALDSFLSAANHLKGFCNFIKTNNLVQALKNHDWASFAYSYNGAGYASNDYDGKIARAYAKLK